MMALREQLDLQPLFRDKQNILREIIKYFVNHRMGYIKVPTGWGKTFLARHLMKEHYYEGKVVLFVVSQNIQLLDQTYYVDESKTKPLFSNSVALSSHHKKISMEELITKIDEKKSGFIIFASLQTIFSEKNQELKNFLIKNVDLVIIDEIHNFIRNRGNKFIDEIGEKTKIFGMTATPFQGIVGNIKFVNEISGEMREIYNKTLPQCIIDGQLSELSYTIIRNNQSIFDVFDLKNGLSALNKQELLLDCSTPEKIDLVIQRTYLAKRIFDTKIKDKSSKTLIFCAPVRNIVQGFEDDLRRVEVFHAKLCAAIFNGEVKDGFRPSSFSNYSPSGQFKYAVYISSKLKKKERQTILDSFKMNGKPPFVLCTVGMLIEGFDFPDLENLILLRPTLSMRLFEQQVGRVTRLSDVKDRGNIFEVVDDIDSLYETFGENVFGEKTMNQIQMLHPEHRIEELFTEDNNIEAIESKKIRISEINFKDTVDEFQENSVQIPPISLRASYFCNLLSTVEEKTDGVFRKKREQLLKMAIGFKIHSLQDAKEMTNLVKLIDRLEQEAILDPRLSKNCQKHKPRVLNEGKWLLKLRALTYLKYFNPNLNIDTKNEILKILGFKGDYNKVDEFRLECLDKGSKQDIKHLFRDIKKVKNLSSDRILALMDKEEKIHWIRRFKPSVYWSSCFKMDYPEFKEIFSSKEWNYKVRKYIIN